MIQVLIVVILLALFQGSMQGIMFYNPFLKLDQKLHINWFASGASPINRDKWTIFLFGKYRKLFGYWPLIMFTDFFHFCHGMFGMLIGEFMSTSGHTDLDRLFCWIIGALGYSCIFELQLRLMKKLKFLYSNQIS